LFNLRITVNLILSVIFYQHSFFVIVFALEDNAGQLTGRDHAALEKFGKISLILLEGQPEYMKTNGYLIRWIRGSNYDLSAASKMLEQSLQWRRENKMDSILQEDFSQLQKNYPYWVDGVDYHGRPISTLPLGSWDLRRAVLTGEMKQITRYLDQMLEKVTIRAIELLPNSTNEVPLQDIIVDADAFSVRQHMCLSCLPIHFSFITHYETYYPETTAKMFVINAPRIFSTLLDTVGPILSASTRRAVSIFGHNKNEWSKAILKVVPAGQLTPQFGGNKIR